MRETRRYLGLELAGAKNQKTALAALEYYPKEKKIFLLDLFDRVVPRAEAGKTGTSGRAATTAQARAGTGTQSNDEALLELIEEMGPDIARLGVNVPLQLPPCIGCDRKSCVHAGHCMDPASEWMREATRRAARQRSKTLKVNDFTPYTQRPIELYMRYGVLPELPESHRFEVDETLGGNKAPLTARMQFLKRALLKTSRFGRLEIVEAWPKLTVAILAVELELSRRVVTSYRNLEEGAYAREEILERLAEEHGIFIYERDVRKLAQNLACFDAFICAYTALLSDLGRCARPVPGFPVASGWVEFPVWSGYSGESGR